mmetsp:Transcript_141165/g.451218  ORF Transcript_141165/g.451218 Transcript_141165/m.451218 type:complete len:555 (-) Transcript_141165:25-1689(-)
MGLALALGIGLLEAAWCADGDASGYAACPPRKRLLLDGHPLLGRPLHRRQLPMWRALAERARALPLGDALCVVYLIQGEEDCSEVEAAVWNATACSEVLRLTFRSRREDALFFPGSRLAEGRNALLGAAAAAELRRGVRFTYYAFLDADATSQPPWSEALPRLEAILLHWLPAVGLPATNPAHWCPRGCDRGIASASTRVFDYDHIFVAVHADAAAALLPYNGSLDGSCWWVSQWRFTLLSLALFRNHVLLFPSMLVSNPVHSSYGKELCEDYMLQATERLRFEAPPAARDCFPDPVRRHILFRGLEATALLGSVGEGTPDDADVILIGEKSYLPWGRPSAPPRRPSGGSLATRYGEVSLPALAGSCAAEPMARALAEGPRVEAEVLGCQIAVAEQPMDVARWSALAGTLRSSGAPRLATLALALARRLAVVAAQFVVDEAVDIGTVEAALRLLVAEVPLARAVLDDEAAWFAAGDWRRAGAAADAVLNFLLPPYRPLLAGAPLARLAHALVVLAPALPLPPPPAAAQTAAAAASARPMGWRGEESFGLALGML